MAACVRACVRACVLFQGSSSYLWLLPVAVASMSGRAPQVFMNAPREVCALSVHACEHSVHACEHSVHACEH